MAKKLVALFQSVGISDWTTVWWAQPGKTDDEADASQPDGYVRISPYIEIEFPALSQDTVVEKQLGQLAKAEAKLRTEFQTSLNNISDLRQKLLALPDPGKREDIDPTLWCIPCGARTKAQCNCLPIAANE